MSRLLNNNYIRQRSLSNVIILFFNKYRVQKSEAIDKFCYRSYGNVSAVKMCWGIKPSNHREPRDAIVKLLKKVIIPKLM